MTNSRWIPTDRIAPLLGLETWIVLGSMTLFAYLFYVVFLRQISARRHSSMRRRFLSLCQLIATSGVFAFGYWNLVNLESNLVSLPKITDYLAVGSLFIGAIAVTRVAQAYVYLYLFLMNIRTGVPRLIANIFTLLLSTVVGGWILSEVFSIRLAPLLATSAIFSVVLGLALQDTLGNFFSGVALQLDHPFSIGDWIEVQNGAQRWTGQVLEITWRATALAGFADELITIPNKTLAQSQVVSFTQLGKPPRCHQTFRFPLGTSVEAAKAAILQGLAEVPQVLQDPPPRPLALEAAKSWILIKIFYSVEDFGMQYRIGDQVLARVMESIEQSGLKLANPTLRLMPAEMHESV